jgi:hypothetical protein
MTALAVRRDEMRLRRVEVAALWLRGVQQAQIAGRLKVSAVTVARDLRALRKEWHTTRVRDFEQSQEQELRKLDLLEREAWEAWDRSLRPVETNKVSGAGSDLSENRRGEKSSRSSHGAARYLEIIARCIDKRCEILGLRVVQPAHSTVVVQTTDIRQALLMNDDFLEYCRDRACHGDAGDLRLLDSPRTLEDVPASGPVGSGASGPGAG